MKYAGEVPREQVVEMLASQGEGHITRQRVQQIENEALCKVGAALLARFGSAAADLLLPDPQVDAPHRVLLRKR